MKSRLSAIIVAVISFVSLPKAAPCQGVPVYDNMVNVQQIKDAAIQAKNWIVEAKGWVDVGNSYLNAVQNTANIPLNAIHQVQSLYYRTEAFGRSVNAFFEADSPMMQRLSMAKSLGSRGASIPTGTVRSAEWWQQRAAEQWADNQKLLGLEDERQAINQQMMEMAASNGDMATGRMQALQAQNQSAAAMGANLQRINDNLEQHFVYQMERDADEDMKREAMRQFMTIERNYQAQQW